MRLIDADAFLEEARNRIDMQDVYLPIHIKYFVIDEMPTIEAEPVRHGKLLRTEAYPHRLYCSECYKTIIPNEEICFEKNEFPKYCMYCGAKLDKEEL